ALIGVWPCAANELGGPVCSRRSTDDGRTWSAPQPLFENRSCIYDVFAGSDGVTAIATGRCIDETGSSPYVSRSTDGGATWTDQRLPETDESTEVTPHRPVGANATWMVPAVLRPAGGGSDEAFVVWRSDDDGVTWERNTVHELPSFDCCSDLTLGTDTAGTWLLAVPLLRSDQMVSLFRSTDDGQTWGAPSGLGSSDLFNKIGEVDLAPAPGGGFVAAVRADSKGAIAGGGDCEVVIGTSADGSTWTGFTLLNPEPMRSKGDGGSCNGDGGTPRLLRRPMSQELWVLWTVAGPPFLRSGSSAVIAKSTDGGQSWTNPAGFGGGSGAEPRGAIDGSGAVAALSLSSGDLVLASSYLECPTAPTETCKAIGAAGSSNLRVRNSPGAKDILQWDWFGPDTSLADFGDPTADATYLLCMYEPSIGGHELAFEREVSPDGDCSDDVCWRSVAAGFRYLDRKNAASPTRSLSLSVAGSEAGGIRFHGKGLSLSPPALPISEDGPVIVELHNPTDSVCWGAEYVSVLRNTDTDFSARQ
ncbi:MAG TPA: sialidase family protein, partial [Terriglobales bacterium]|nr:sialidase family protein [Terriglobales bacterium]